MKASEFSDLGKYEVIMEQLMLGDRVNPDDKKPVVVKVLRDKKTQRAYQVDFKNNEYRDSRHVLEPYSDWKKLE